MTLTLDELRRLVAQSEDAHVELKEQPSDQVLREFSTDIASVANGKGGAFIFGVTNAKELVGYELTGGERERISQEAAKCRPPVQIEFDEAVAENGKRFLVVYVPVATTLPHSDFRDKTPVRVGNITAYLDASGVVGWLNERGLLRREPAESRQSYAEMKREPISDDEALAIAAGLNSGSRDARLEALRDLAHLSHRRVVLDRKELAAPTGGILLRGPLEHVKLILEGLRSVVLWGTTEEKRPVVEWFVRITELARGLDNPEIARMAFDVLQCAHRGEAADVLAEWVTEADDKTWSALAASHQLGNVRFYGLDRPMRAAMHRILEGTPPDTVKLRVSEVLEALRRAYG